MNTCTYSIILPIYNQEDQIRTIVESYSKGLNSLKDTWELLLIVNGSRDKSYQVASEIAKNNKNISVYNLKIGGWGRAVKYGLSKGKGDFLCYTNSARTDVKDLILILKYAKVNDSVVIKASRIIRDNIIRKMGSIIYNLECRFIYQTPIWDVNGTPKVIPKSIYKKLKIHSEDDLIDAELMIYCTKNSVPIIEIPITLTMRISGKSTTSLMSALKMYYGLIKLRFKL